MVKAIIFSLKSGSMMEPNTTSIPNPKKVVVAAATTRAVLVTVLRVAVLVLAAGREGWALQLIGGFGFFLSFSLAILILLENFLHRRKR